MEKLGLVLSGGGSKGAYEAGVYKALRKLKIKPNIVTGTSIGAVNGMIIVQKNYYKLRKFWNTISFSTMYKEEEFPILKDPNLKEVYTQYAKAFINGGGLDIIKLKKLFDRYYNPKKFFKSDIDYGIVTYNLTKKHPDIKTKRELTEKNIKDYVLASATCYPAFKPYHIGKDLYIDGGYHDNLPINLAVDLGATKIIAVDLRAIGLKKNIKDKSVEVTYISPRNKIASFLIFDKKYAKEAIKFGYNDAMKTFKKLDGDKFTFRRYNMIKNYNRYNDNYEENLNIVFNGIKNKLINNILEIPIIKETIERQIEYKHFNTIVETAGRIFKFEESNIYSINSYNRGLVNNLSNTKRVDIEMIKEKITNGNIRRIIDERQIVKYFYECIQKKDKSMLKFIIPFKNEFLTALYIYTVK